MERRQARPPRNPDRIVHPDRLRHIQSALRTYPNLCSLGQAIHSTYSTSESESSILAQVIAKTEPHFLFVFDQEAVEVLTEQLQKIWNWRKPKPHIFLAELDSEISVIPKDIAFSLEANLPDEGERRRACVVSDTRSASRADVLLRFLRGRFPWMDVFPLDPQSLGE